MRLILTLLAILISSCSSNPTSEDPIAEVNGVQISVRDYLNLYDNLKPKDISLQGLERAKMKNLVIQTLVRRQVILTSAREQNISVSDDELMGSINRIKSGYPEDMFQEMLLEGMVDETEWKEQVRQNLLIEKMFEAKKSQIEPPSIEDALHFYENNPHLFQKHEEISCLHLVTNDAKLAGELRTKLLKDSSPASFRKLAREHSIGPEAQDDAEITIQRGMMPDEIDTRVFDLQIGKISPVISSPYGHHIFKLISKQPAVNLDFKQVRQQIFERLYEERKQDWLERFEADLIRSADIAYNRELIAKL